MVSQHVLGAMTLRRSGSPQSMHVSKWLSMFVMADVSQKYLGLMHEKHRTTAFSNIKDIAMRKPNTRTAR
jgi:hypothetical protein